MLAKSRLIPVIALMMLCLSITPAFCQSNDESFINQVEEQLFSTTYSQDTLSDRLTRLEETIFGASSPADAANIRVEKLKALLAPASTPQAEPDNSMSSVDLSSNNDQQQHSIQDDSITNYSNYTQEQTQDTLYPDDVEVEDYPVLSYLENQVFDKSYKGEDISKRLGRLEMNIFNQEKPNQPLSDRIDSLKVAIVGKEHIDLAPRFENQNENSGGMYYQDPRMNSQNYFPPPGMNTFQYSDANLGPTYGQQNNNMNMNDYMPAEPGYDVGNISDEGLKEVTSRLEEQLLGRSFMNENLNTRLDRLEMQVFNKTSSGYAPESRIERLVAVTAAEATSDPDDLRKIKRLRKVQTGLTVGGILFSLLRGFMF